MEQYDAARLTYLAFDFFLTECFSAEKTWAKLFQIFAKCARYVITTKRNEVREHIAAQFLNELHSCEFEVH